MAENMSSISDYNSTMEAANATEALEPVHYPHDMLGFTAACAFIIALFGTLGNLLTIFALPMSKKLRTTATAFVINLAVVELMFCLFILPISGAQYAYLQYSGETLLSNSDCTFFALFRYTFTQVELQTILAIALTRAIAVGFPSFYQKIDNAVVTAIYIAIIWLYSFFIRVPTALKMFGSYGFNTITMECDMASSLMSQYARFIFIIIEVFIPVPLILLLYIFIFVMVIRRGIIRSQKFRKPSCYIPSKDYVKKSSMRVAKGRHKPPKSSSTSTAPSSTSEELSFRDTSDRKPSLTSYKSLKRMVSDSSLKARFTRRSSSTCLPPTSRRDMRVARMIFIIFLMVIICSIPVGFVHAIDKNGEQPRRLLAVHILYWLQYCLNVIVYVLMNKQYRDAYIDFVAKILPSCQRHKSFVFPWENASISSRPPQGLNSSFKNRKDSLSKDSPAKQKEYKPVDVVTYIPKQSGRLSAILEVNSSSCVSNSNDDVFVDNLKPIKGLDDTNSGNDEKDIECSSLILALRTEKENDKKKQHWVTTNGETLRTPNEDAV